jgi:hypothetical protein
MAVTLHIASLATDYNIHYQTAPRHDKQHGAHAQQYNNVADSLKYQIPNCTMSNIRQHGVNTRNMAGARAILHLWRQTKIFTTNLHHFTSSNMATARKTILSWQTV